jgi:cephalosporin hydroxylase
MFIREQLEADKQKSALAQSLDGNLQKQALDFIVSSDRYGYAYQWTWLGLPIIQLPADIMVTQEIIWRCRPDVIVETGVAWGGSIVMYASLMALYGKGEVIGVDLNLHDHVAKQILSFPFSHRIQLYKGSSIDPAIVAQVKGHASSGKNVMVLLDSNHTHEHVLSELRLYAPLVSPGQYLIVSDTVVEDIPVQTHRPRPWGPGNNPKTALQEFLKGANDFEEDEYINSKVLTTFNPNGYIRRRGG